MHPQQPPAHYPPPPPLPADDRIKRGVRAGETFPDPYDAQRAVAYAQGFLSTGEGLARPPVLLAIAAGFIALVVLEVTVGVVYVLVVPFAVLVGLVGYLIWWKTNRPRVEQSLAANRHVIGS